jgi:hypothetical protein
MRGANRFLPSVPILIMCLLGVAKGQEAVCNDKLQLGLYYTDPMRSQKEVEARDFLWQHWSGKKCGELVISAASREGDPSTSRYALSLTLSGNMLLTISSSQEHSDTAWYSNLPPPPRPPPPPSKKHTSEPTSGPPVTLLWYRVREAHSYIVYYIERVQLRAKSPSYVWETIPVDKHVSPAEYHLRLEDIEGKTIGDF